MCHCEEPKATKQSLTATHLPLTARYFEYMKKYATLLLLLLSSGPSLSYSDDARRIEEIKNIFAEWRPIVTNASSDRLVIYRYASGANYENLEWSNKVLKTDEKAMSDKFTIIKKDMGTYLHHEQYSFSGDWSVVSEHYYGKNGKLFFVFWKMNTFQADKPATIEKRLYFSENGKIIKSLKDVFKLNTKQQQNVNFMDHEVEYSTDFKSLAFYEQLPKHR